MLRRIRDLLTKLQDFAFETTLSTRSFVSLINQARKSGYAVTLLYYRLDSVELAIERVKIRVSEGGHHIPEETIVRRYYAGLKNFMFLYKDKVDDWLLIDNSEIRYEIIAEGHINDSHQVTNFIKWEIIKTITFYDA